LDDEIKAVVWAFHVRTHNMSSKPEHLRPLRRHRRRWEGNIKVDIEVAKAWATFMWFRLRIRGSLLWTRLMSRFITVRGRTAGPSFDDGAAGQKYIVYKYVVVLDGELMNYL
jgi:hypothetical protein